MVANLLMHLIISLVVNLHSKKVVWINLALVMI